MTDLKITRITGMNSYDPPASVPEDQCVSAVNVEFWDSALGERRAGSNAISVPAAFSGDANIQAITWLHRHIPTATVTTDSELWALGQHLTSTNFSLQRQTTSAWNTITPAINIEVAGGQGYRINGASFRGKLHIMYPNTSATDRSMVWDGTSLRKSGLAEPAAPTGANDGGVGTFAGDRYYRVRYTVQSGGTTILRSEPSDVLTFSPNGNDTGITVTKPATISESETHWELEASIDNANFYRIATTIVGTTTVTDTTDFSTGYASYTLSEDIGAYSLPHSAEFVIIDEDRVIWGGAWEDTTKASRVLWSPVFGAEGVGNDERWDATTDPFLDLDSHDGGPITCISKASNGQIWVFKESKTFILVRTGQVDRAYNAIKISDTIGAVRKSVVQGVTESGEPCLYFIDPILGPCRTGGRRQIQACGKDILETWKSVNLSANVVARGVFYPKKLQVIWNVATDEATSPDLGIILHIANTSEQIEGIRGGWSLWDGPMCEAYASCLFSDNVDEAASRSHDLVPLYGVSAANGYILMGDTGSDDDGTAYAASILTKPVILRGLLSKFGVGAAAILTDPSAATTIDVTLHRDFGLEEPRTATVTLTADDSETQVIKQIRELTGSQFYAVQVEFEDPDTPTGAKQWKLQRFDMSITDQEKAFG